MAKSITTEELRKAIEIYCVGKGLTFSEGESDGTVRFLLSPGEIDVRIANGRIICEDRDTYEKLAELIMDMRQAGNTEAIEPHKTKRTSVPATRNKSDMGRMDKLTIADVRSYFCPTATDQEAYTFLQICASSRANPWLGEAYLIKYDERTPAKTVMGKYHFLKRASEHPKYGGFTSGIIVQLQDGRIEERIGKFHLPDEKLVGAWAEVIRTDRTVPKKVTVSLKEYAKDNKQWRAMPATMIEKVAIVQAHRDMFPSELGGLYDSAEIIDADCEVLE